MKSMQIIKAANGYSIQDIIGHLEFSGTEAFLVSGNSIMAVLTLGQAEYLSSMSYGEGLYIE